jgi:adenosylcobinamide kinase/adenosylcobinamide-phosphate guanylyltransferase
VLTLVLGGTRSGKSAFAVELVRAAGGPVTYLATGVASDGEMRRRIEAHRRARPAGWTLVEEPLAIGAAVPAGAGTVVLDSVDTWLANRMEAAGGAEADLAGDRGDALVADCAAEVAGLDARVGHLVAVSAEVGLSLLPLSAYGRAFTDLLGALNQRLAAGSAEVYLVTAGIPLSLKSHRRRADP